MGLTFALPTIEAVLRAVDTETWGTDVDLGEMFLNFTLHESLQQFCGVDLMPYFTEDMVEGCQMLWERWTRCLMILPYQMICAFLLAGRRGDKGRPSQQV
jgi:hypothetical protein